MNTQTRRLTAGIALLLIGLSLILSVNLTAPRTARANPGVLYAASTAQGSGDCSSWANACTLQTALAWAVSGDEIWVKAGVHYPGAAGNRTATFTLKNGVALYGGFAGTETSRDQRDWQTNVTILSGDIDHNDINTDGNYIAETWNDIQGSNAYHVVTGSGTNATAVLDGFVITAGQASSSRGGGMYNENGSPALHNIIFSGNFAYWNGGGMYNYNASSPTLTNVTFSGNSADRGGGIYNYSNSSPTLANVTFNGNAADRDGGGMYNYDNSNPALTNVTFSSNTADEGGGMYNENSNPTLEGVTFNGNSATTDGGGMLNYYSSPTLTNVTFSSNTANNGGGMYNYYSNPTLTNIILDSNSTTTNGGGIYNGSSSPVLIDVTFGSNSAISDGGGMYNDSSSPALINVTFSSNSAGWGGGMSNWFSSPVLTNTTFISNTVTGHGGGMYNSYASPRLTNITFSRNSANSRGGGMYNTWGSDSLLTNVIFDRNSAAVYGGGMCNGYYAFPHLINVTFSGNTANYGGGIYNYSYNDLTLANVIVWGNTAAVGGDSLYDYDTSNTLAISYSNIEGCGGFGNWNSACGTDGGNNIDADPLFVDAASGNLRLQAGSPSIDAGNDGAVPPGVTTDLDGNPRFNYTVDMGAYEYQHTASGPRPFGKALPLSGDTSQPLSVSLSWRASVLANRYEYCYDTINNDACDATWLTTTETSVNISNLNAGISYYWQVRAVNNEGTTDADGGFWWSFTTTPSAPGFFNKASPARGATYQPFSPTLSWNASPGVERYEYCYDTTDDNTCSPWLSVGTAISVTLTNLLPGTTYYWQVRAVNVYGVTYANRGSTNYWAFTTYPRPGDFNKISPTSGSDRLRTVTLSWSASRDVGAYEYCYDTTNDNDCSTWLSVGMDTSVALSNLLPNTTYYWQVRARNMAGITYADGSSTGFWSFTTAPSPGAFSKVSPAHNAETEAGITLSWGASTDAAIYEYCYDTTDDGICSQWQSAGTSTSVALNLGPGTYYWQVRARNVAGITYANGSSTDFWSFRVNIARWSGGKISFLTDIERTQWMSFTLRFGGTFPCIVQYGPPIVVINVSFEETVIAAGPGVISNDQFGFSSPTFSFTGQFNSAITATGTYSLTNYQVVRDVYYSGTIHRCVLPVTLSEAWSASRPLLRPGVFGKTEPANGATNQNTSLALGWNPSIEATEYQYCLDTTANNTCDTSWVSTGTNLGVALSGLAENTTYYWQVRASNTVGATEADSGVWWSFTTQDTIAPTVISITRADASPTNAATVGFIVAFSEAVQGVDAGDFGVTATGLTGASVTGISGGGATYTVTVSTGSGSGTLRLDIPATATISDPAGNPLSGLPYTSGEAYEVSKARHIFLPLVIRN